MKSLKTVQTLAKVGRVLSLIVFVCSIIGFVGCVVGAVVLGVVGADKYASLIEFAEKASGEKFAVSLQTALTAAVCGAIVCAGEAVLSKFAERYFKRELNDGTPFTCGGAAELRRLGLLAIFIPIGAYAAAFICYTIMAYALADVSKFDSFSGGGSISIGVMMLVASCLCKLGAEQAERNAAPEAAETPEQPLQPVPPEL